MGCGPSDSNRVSNVSQSTGDAKGAQQHEDTAEEERRMIVYQMHAAAKAGDVDELGRLLSTNAGLACINEKEYGRALLHQAASNSKFDILRLVVDKGAEIDVVKGGWGTPLTLACKWGYESMAEYLLSKGASKEMAISAAPESIRALVEGFFIDLERVIQQRKEFEGKREELKAMMKYAERPENLPTTCKGITIGGLRKMKTLLQTECKAGRFQEDNIFPDGTHCNGTTNFEDLSTTDIVYRFVKDNGITSNLRLIDTDLVDAEHKAIPSLFISHAWKGRISKLLQHAFDYAERRGLSDDYAVWIDVFSVNQHGNKDCTEFSRAQNGADVAAFEHVVQTCIDGTLVVCDFDMCKTYSRAWCLFEWDWTMFYHGREKLQFLGLSKDEAGEGRGTIDVEQADCFMIEDKVMILREIVDKHGSTGIFNDKLRAKWTDVEAGLF